MIHPSYVDLMQAVNRNVAEGEEPVISSRYSIVMATARRARQIIAGDEPLVRARNSVKALSIAVEELNCSEVRILNEAEKEEMHRQIAEELAQAASEAGHDADEVAPEVADVMRESEEEKEQGEEA